MLSRAICISALLLAVACHFSSLAFAEQVVAIAQYGDYNATRCTCCGTTSGGTQCQLKTDNVYVYCCSSAVLPHGYCLSSKCGNAKAMYESLVPDGTDRVDAYIARGAFQLQSFDAAAPLGAGSRLRSSQRME